MTSRTPGRPPPPEDERVAAYYGSAERARAIAELRTSRTPLGRLYRERIVRLLELLAPVDGGRLLDVGCDGGQLLAALAEARPGEFELTGLDCSTAMIDVARSALGASARLVVGRAETLPFSDDRFDVVLGIGLLEYVVDLGLTLSEIRRVLVPGGLAIVTMQNRLSPHRLWDELVYRPLRGGRVGSPLLRRLGERRLTGELEAARLVPTDILYYDFNVVPAPLDARLAAVATRLADLLAPLGRGPLRRLGTGFIVSSRRPSA